MYFLNFFFRDVAPAAQYNFLSMPLENGVRGGASATEKEVGGGWRREFGEEGRRWRRTQRMGATGQTVKTQYKIKGNLVGVIS